MTDGFVRRRLLAINGAAGLLLLMMSDLDASTRLPVAGALAVNVVLLIGRGAQWKGPARAGAYFSLAGYVGVVMLWLVLAIGCGIEYYSPRCDAVVTPLLEACVAVSLVALPAGRACDVFAKG